MSNVKKEVLNINGKEVIFPVPTQEQIPFGMARKIRGAKKSEQSMESIFLILEFFLSDDEMEAWDYLSGDEIKSALEAVEKLDFLTK